MAEIKVFVLRFKSGILKIRKFEIAQTSTGLSKRQAKIIQFSPDTKWLATIAADNSIHIYRRSEAKNDKTSTPFLQTSIELKRLRRGNSNTMAKDASLGNYSRSINRLTFSTDSRILAVSDISGFLDTWVVEGQEDLEQGNDQQPNAADAAENSDSSDEEDSEEGESRTVLFGERWIRNPAASLLPKVPAAPLVLTFRPSTSSQDTMALTNGNVGVHPTRHNPHPHSHDLPNGEDRLFLLTAENQMYEFNVLSGKISDWSRRNPTSSLPHEFRELRDRVKGAVWDVRGQNERIWLYGVAWLWMLDLSRDLPVVDEGQQGVCVTSNPNKEVSLKRKREDREEESTAGRPQNDTGAGSKIPNAELGIGIGRKMRRIDGEDQAAGQWIKLDARQDSFSDEDGGFVLANESDDALIKLRRGGNDDTNSHMPNGRHVDDGTDVDASENDDAHFAKMRNGRRPAYWYTYKYRPILGIVALGGETGDETAEGEDDDDSPPGLEVALVERPLFDVDLPPRYVGNQEWNS